MKIAIFNTLYSPNIIGGAEKSVQLLAEGLLEKGHEPVIVTTDREDRVDQINKIKVYYLNYRNLYWGIESANKPKIIKPIWHLIDRNNPFIKKKISKIIEDELPDIIFTNNLSGLSIHPWTIGKSMGIPIVHTLRDYSMMCIKSGMFKNGCNCQTQCNICREMTKGKKHLSDGNYVNYLVGNSEFIIKRHKELGYFKDVPAKRIYNGAELPSLFIGKSEGTEQDKRNGSNAIKFLYMGRIDTSKGVDILLDIFSELTDVELYLAGKVVDSRIMEKKVKGQYPKNIKFLGFVKPNEILPYIDIVIVPSKWHEPLPRVALEAYANNKVVLGSNRGGIPEVVKHGVTGYIFDLDKKESIIKYITLLKNNPELIEDMAKEIPNHIKQYDIKRSIDEYEELFKSLIIKQNNTVY